MTLLAPRPSHIRALAAHRAADVLDIMAITFFAASAMIVAASVPFYWVAGALDAVSAAVRPKQEGDYHDYEG